MHTQAVVLDESDPQARGAAPLVEHLDFEIGRAGAHRGHEGRVQGLRVEPLQRGGVGDRSEHAAAEHCLHPEPLGLEVDARHGSAPGADQERHVGRFDSRSSAAPPAEVEVDEVVRAGIGTLSRVRHPA